MNQGFVLFLGRVFRLAEIDRVRRNIKTIGRLVVTSRSHDASVNHVDCQYDRERRVPTLIRRELVTGIRDETIFSV